MNIHPARTVGTLPAIDGDTIRVIDQHGPHARRPETNMHGPVLVERGTDGVMRALIVTNPYDRDMDDSWRMGFVASELAGRGYVDGEDPEVRRWID